VPVLVTFGGSGIAHSAPVYIKELDLLEAVQINTGLGAKKVSDPETNIVVHADRSEAAQIDVGELWGSCDGEVFTHGIQCGELNTIKRVTVRDLEVGINLVDLGHFDVNQGVAKINCQDLLHICQRREVERSEVWHISKVHGSTDSLHFRDADRLQCGGLNTEVGSGSSSGGKLNPFRCGKALEGVVILDLEVSAVIESRKYEVKLSNDSRADL